jgi:hypothetical protein
LLTIIHHFIGCIIFLFFGINNVLAQDEYTNNDAKGNLKYVDPRIGNVGQLLQPTRPTVQQPNQLIRMYPKRNDYMDDQIASFPLSIVSHRLGEVFSLKPWDKEVYPGSWKLPRSLVKLSWVTGKMASLTGRIWILLAS